MYFNTMQISTPNLMVLLVLIMVTAHVSCSKGPDVTLIPGASGSLVVQSVLGRISASCLFHDDRMFLRRLAYAQTRDGTDPKTYKEGTNGGIWQVDRPAFHSSQISEKAKDVHKDVRSTFGINWTSVLWSDLRKPFVSGLAAALYMATFPEGVPRTLDRQASYYQRYFRFSNNAQRLFRASVLHTNTVDDGIYLLHHACSEDEPPHKSYNILLGSYAIPNICVSHSTSYQPHPSDKTKFIICRADGGMYIFQCVPGYVYTPGSRKCLPRDSVNPTNSTSEATSNPDSPTPSASTTTPMTSLFPLGYPRTTIPTLPTRTVLETVTDVSKLTVTKQPVAMPTSSTPGKYSLPPAYTVPVPDSSPYNTGSAVLVNPCISAVLNDLFYYAHPGDRKKYIQCDSAGNPREMTCPRNMIWREELLQCIPNGLFVSQLG